MGPLQARVPGLVRRVDGRDRRELRVLLLELPQHLAGK